MQQAKAGRSLHNYNLVKKGEKAKAAACVKAPAKNEV